MEIINAVYVRMNVLLEELGIRAFDLYREISGLKEKTARLHVSWQGEAFEEYHRVLMKDLSVMEVTAIDAIYIHRLLKEALTEYQKMEMRISETVGGLKL